MNQTQFPSRRIPRNLTRLSTRRWLQGAAVDWATIIGTFWVMSGSNAPGLWIAGFLIIGARQQGLGWLGHEGVHRCISRSRAWNDGLANWLAFRPLGVDVAAFREFHLQHHRHLGGRHDPEQDHLPLPTAPQGPLHLALRFAWHCLGGAALGTIRVLVLFRPRGTKGLIEWSGLITGALVVSIAAGLPWLVPVWILIQLTTFSAFFQLRLLMEHTGIPGRTHRFRVGPIWRFFVHPHNSWCHDEHHRWSAIPFHNLKAARALTATGADPTVYEWISSLSAKTQRPSTDVATGKAA